MTLPTNREEFKRNCLRECGEPVIKVNVAPQQVDDAVENAFQFFAEYHFDAQYKTLLKHQITQTDVDNGYLTMPENVQHVVKIFPLGDGISNGIFSLRYQLSLNDLYDLSSSSLSSYVVAMQYVSTIQNVLTPESSLRFQRHMNRIIIDSDFDIKYRVGQWILIEVMMLVDPDQFPDVWKDRMLRRLCVAYINLQWGKNLKKYGQIQLPGGTTLNGQQIYDDAVREVEEVEGDFKRKFEEPIDFVVA